MNPPKVKVDWTNETEMMKFKERRRFESYRQMGHYYFDKIWSEARIMTREEAYQWLAKKLRSTEEEAHFGLMDDKRCANAIWFCQQLLNDNRRFDLDFGCEPITPGYILDA